MTKEAYLEFCANLEEAVLDQPFGEKDATIIARHRRSKKWFAAIMERGGKDFVNLKCEPLEAEFLRSRYVGITPGYHMNKRHWISIYLDSDVSEDLIKHATQESYRLTQPKFPRNAKSVPTEE